jgi:hypothetical protein
MIDVDDELTAYAREWRAAQPPLPPVVVEQRAAPRRRSRWIVAAAALVVVLAVGAVALVATRSHESTPSIDAPPTTPPTTAPANVPHVDVVPLYLPIDAADIAAAAAVHRAIGFQLTADHPTHAQIIRSRACEIALLGLSTGRLNGFEDPGSYVGPPIAPSVAAPAAPPTRRCTDGAANAAARVREIATALDWLQLAQQTDADDTVATAKARDVQCLAERGVAGVTFAFIADPSGSSQAHPEWNSQIQVFADCFAPVVAARAPVRQAFRDQFVQDHRGEIERLQRSFDDYLRAIYAPPPHAKTVTTQPDLARYDRGCVRITELTNVPPATAPYAADTPDAALAFARRAVDDASASPVRSIFGEVSVCDRASIRHRMAWVFEFPGTLVVVDAANGKILLNRPIDAR